MWNEFPLNVYHGRHTFTIQQEDMAWTVQEEDGRKNIFQESKLNSLQSNEK
jgi:hypothetical protein